MRYLIVVLLFLCSAPVFAQTKADAWADSVYKSLKPHERIAQLMVVRLSSIDMSTRKVTFYDKQVEELVKKYNVGGVLVFQGGPIQQAQAINRLQKIAQTPIMFSIDGEWGVGQRLLDSVQSLPKQMMLGATSTPALIYQYGKIVAEQCKRLGIHVNYAPVVDVNNNAANPVINDRSFGEDMYKVAEYGIQYMKGMQDNGVMACAKHFPGHGDVTVDSHYDLPVINKSMEALNALELYPFKEIFKAGVGSVMIAHLYIPAIDNTVNKATSVSEKNVTGLMRQTIGYQGLTFTDALEMKGVQKFYPGGEAAVEALVAGNDILCLPTDVPATIKAIEKAIKHKKLSWDDIEYHCKRLLKAKYQYVVSSSGTVSYENLAQDLNKYVPDMITAVAKEAITLLSDKHYGFFPLRNEGRIAFVGLGLSNANAFAKRMETDYGTTGYYIPYNAINDAKINSLLQSLKSYDKIIIGLHNTTRVAKTNYGINAATINFVRQLNSKFNTMVFLFGNAYAAAELCELNNFAIAYEDDALIQEVAADMLSGKLPYKGKLPVTICNQYSYGSGILTNEKKK